MSAFVIASSWQQMPSSQISPPYASRDGAQRPLNAVIDIQDPQLHAPVTFAFTDLEMTAGLEAKRNNRSGSGPTFRICEQHITGECPQGHECSDAHVDRATLNEVRTNILRWLADKEHEFGQQVAASSHNPISYKIFCSDLKEIVDVPAASITFTRGLFADPGVRTNKRQQATGNPTAKPAEVNNSASTPTACGLFASDPSLCKWGKWCNQAHIDPQFLSKRKQVFSQWAIGHEQTFNTMPADAVFLVHDPVIKRSVEIPRGEISEFTRGLFQQSGAVAGPPNSRKAPSLCLLFQKRRCTAGACCNQIHVKSDAVNRFRAGQPGGGGLGAGLGADMNNMGGPQRQKGYGNGLGNNGQYGPSNAYGGGSQNVGPNGASNGAYRQPNSYNQQGYGGFGGQTNIPPNQQQQGQGQGQYYAPTTQAPNNGFQHYPQFHPYPQQPMHGQQQQHWDPQYQTNGYQQQQQQQQQPGRYNNQPNNQNYFQGGMGMNQQPQYATAQPQQQQQPSFHSSGNVMQQPQPGRNQAYDQQPSFHQQGQGRGNQPQPLPPAAHSQQPQQPHTPTPPAQASGVSSPTAAGSANLHSITSNRLVSPTSLPEAGPTGMSLPQLSLPTISERPPTPPAQHLSRADRAPTPDASMSQNGSPSLGASTVMRKRNNPYEPAPQRMVSPTSPSRGPDIPQYNLSNSSFTGGGGVNASFVNHLSSPMGPNRQHSGAAPGSPLALQERGAFSQSMARAPSGNQHHSFSHRPPSRQQSYAGGAPEFSFTPLLGANGNLANDSFNFDPVFGSFADHPDTQQGPAMSESFAAGRGEMGSGRMRQLLSGSNQQRRPIDSGMNGNRY